MAVHNGEAFLRETLNSVSIQDLNDFEFIVVDDGSSDATPKILSDAAAADSRIKIVRNARNLGLTKSLNVGLALARGTYIARIDADDICLPQRLSMQAGFLDMNRDHIGVACGFRVIDDRGRILWTVSGGLDDWQVRWLAGFNPPAPHPTYFFRRVDGNGTPFRYDESYATGQDVDLWSRLSEIGNTAVLPEVLIAYRRHPDAITVTQRKQQAANARIIGKRNLRRRLPDEIVDRLEPLLALFAYDAAADGPTIKAAVAGCDAMLAHDLEIAPSAMHRRWVRRTAAGLLADAILSRAGALHSVSKSAAFLFYARSYLLALLDAATAQPGLALKSLRAVGRTR